MSDATDEPAPAGARKPVSMSKDVRPKAAARSPRPSTNPAAATAVRPKQAMWAIYALAASGVASVVAAIALRGERAWLIKDQIDANAKSTRDAAADLAKKKITQADYDKTIKDLPDPAHHASQVMSSLLTSSLLVVAVVAFLAFGVYRGRHWSRWGVSGFWLLASFTGTAVGVNGLLTIASSIPAGYRVPAFLSGLALVIAVVLVNFKSNLAWFAAHRPVPPAGAPARRGLFAPRPPVTRPGGGEPGKGTGLRSSAASRGEAYLDRQKSKKRAAANAESVARGAELARNRAKASKSRKIER